MDLWKCLTCCCSCSQNPVTREDMSYVFCTKEKLDRLETAMRMPKAKKHDIETRLDLPENRGRQPTSEVQCFIDMVSENDDKVKQLLGEYDEGCCARGPCCLNCFARYRISRDAVKLLEEIMHIEKKEPQVSFIEQQPQPVTESHKIVGEKIKSNCDIALKYLANETVGMIGIWGMGGVGKSELLKKINRLLHTDANKGFRLVLLIEASKDMQVEELRKMIATRLRLEPSATKEDISKVLRLNDFVLLLDNIWEAVDLANLGIPHPNYSDNNSIKQCKHKVIFTTRSEDVCAQMGARKLIKVECLESDEAWDLFKDNVNLDVIESDKNFKEIAWQVMKKCGGLPLALQVIGKAMSNRKTLSEWNFILTSLKNSNIKVVPDVQISLLQILKYSYDDLPDNIKKCFLATCMLQGLSIYELLECWMGLGLIEDFDNLEEAYDKAKFILKILEASCLLYFSHDTHVHLHDVIYEMALWIASDCGMNSNRWIVKKYNGSAKISTNDTENWRLANQVIIDGIKLLPILAHQCSNLLCLTIQHSSQLKKIPEGFFGQLKNLTYLDLSCTSISKLPEDIGCLTNLQHLNISYTKISSLPKELANLENLQNLICNNLTGLGKVEEGLMSGLHKLKVINLYPTGWVEPKELKILKKHIKAIGMCVASQEVLQQLSCLPTTQLYIEHLDDLSSLSFDTLSCQTHRSLHQLYIKSCPQLKELVMNGRETHLNNLIINDVKQLQNIIWIDISPPNFFHMLKTISITKCKLTNFAWVLHLPCLVYLLIKHCAEIEMLFYVEEGEIQQVSERPTFPCLEVLELSMLPKLVSISNFALDFPRLSRLSVIQCRSLKKLWLKPPIDSSQRIEIWCDRELWEGLEWDDSAIPSQRLRHYSNTFWLDASDSCTIS
ncbi:P-loop containing nucleoside triphosphate hydrolase protein [Dioscorea alata]|uniref:P-loop containing nucleoside triphosphate hydrolase protein n=1 Tax=Dioscorea alata TaxID=55571 RepID=A0ACB7VQJ7_DIOAL|nr:P-loop containing nucleoside triphosphate hydrolase protein [Dioscorea alata]